MQKRFMIPLAAFVVIGGTTLVALPAYAQENAGNTSMAQRVAQHFNLNQDEVEGVVQEFRESRHQEMKSEFLDQLTQAVTDGSLTQEQMQLILDKHSELEEKREANREAWRSLSKEERRQKMQTEVSALKAWTAEHGIDLQWLRPAGRGGRHSLNHHSS